MDTGPTEGGSHMTGSGCHMTAFTRTTTDGTYIREWLINFCELPYNYFIIIPLTIRTP